MYLDKLPKNSTRNAITLEFKNKLENSSKEIKEQKETQIYYQIAVLIISMMGLLILVLYIIESHVEETHFMNSCLLS